jgi:hypothetical protein
MKRALFASVVALLCACGGSNGGGGGTGGNGGGGTGTGGGGTDMSAGAGSDAGMTLPPDMLPAYGCNALNSCLDACTDQASCQLCLQSSTQQARMLYQAASRCVRQACYPHADAGMAPCSNGGGGGGTPSAECMTCTTDVLMMAGSCGADTKYCGSCYAQYQACLNDKP